MKYQLHKINPEACRLIVFFCGWASDANSFVGIETPEGYDILYVWDYRDLSNFPSFIKNYIEIVVIAWSFGIPAANLLLQKLSDDPEINITGKFAINGSWCPVDDEMGIPKEIFKSTLDNLSVTNLQKFRKRIAGGSSAYSENSHKLCTVLTLDELQKELSLYHPETGNKNFFPVTPINWDFVFISENDLIFPLKNLLKAWAGFPLEIIKNKPHFPDFQYIVDKVVRNKDKIGTNFNRKKISYNHQASNQKQGAIHLMESLAQMKLCPENILEIGSGSGFISSELQKLYPNADLTLMDLCPDSPIKNCRYIGGDAEVNIKKLKSNEFDLVVSGSTFQWFHSPTRFFQEIYQVLKPEGVLGFTLYTDGTFTELHSVTGVSLPFLTSEYIEEKINLTGFRILEKESSTETIKFKNSFEVFKHLSATGVNSISDKTKSVADMKKIIANYPLDLDHKAPLSYCWDMIIAIKDNQKTR